MGGIKVGPIDTFLGEWGEEGPIAGRCTCGPIDGPINRDFAADFTGGGSSAIEPTLSSFCSSLSFIKDASKERSCDMNALFGDTMGRTDLTCPNASSKVISFFRIK
jgi:hypothetical protein